MCNLKLIDLVCLLWVGVMCGLCVVVFEDVCDCC